MSLQNLTANRKHTFKIDPGEMVKITAKLATAIEFEVNKITKFDTVAQLSVESFENFFIVRMGSHSVLLAKEHEDGIITHIAHVTLECEDPKTKKILFGVWKRLKQSKILN